MSATILVVEDERIIAADIRSTLQSLGYLVPPTCATGPDAVAQVKCLHPDLVLMDIQLSGPLDGIETAALLQEQFAMSVVYLTGNSDPATLARAKLTVPYGYVLKPFEDRELHVVVEMALHRRRMEEELQAVRALQEATLNCVAEGILTTDVEQRVTFLNPAGCALLGCVASDVSGRWLTTVLRGVGGQVLLLQRDGEGAVELPDGRHRLLEWHATPIRRPGYPHLGTVLAFRDVGPQRAAENALRELNGVLEQRVEERTRQLRQTSAHLERVSRQQERMLATARDGIFSLDGRGFCVLINPAALQILRCTSEELATAPMHDMLHRNADHEEEACPLLQAMGREVGAWQGSDCFTCPDGQQVQVEYSVSAVHESDTFPANQAPTGVVVVFRDATARLEFDRIKDEFVSTVSHEVRPAEAWPPVASRRGTLGLLGGGYLGDLSPQGQSMLDMAVKNADRLVRLINDILDIERMQSGHILLEQHEIDVGALVQSAVDALQGVAVRRQVQLESKAGHHRIIADEDRVLQVLINLVGNALKFSHPGGTVRVGCDAADGGVRFSVADDGPGIPIDKQGLIFDRFQQGGTSDSPAKGGTGLGLAIARAIVEQHGGRLWVESQVGRGSTFYFTLPA